MKLKLSAVFQLCILCPGIPVLFYGQLWVQGKSGIVVASGTPPRRKVIELMNAITNIIK
jgi:hypothetical protein